MRQTTVLRALDAWRVRTPDAVALRCRADALTWSALLRETDRAAARLLAEGVKPGDRVALLGGMSLDWAVTALGAIRVGAILCPLNERYPASELADVLRELTPAVLVVGAAHRETAERAAEASVRLPMESFADGAPAAFDLPGLAADPSAPVCVIPTSGSTGLPKAVVYTHESLLGAFFEWTLQAPELMRATTLNISAMSFAAGLLNGFLAPLVLGGRVVMMPVWNPDDALGLIEEHEVTCIAATTIFFEQMAALPRFADADLTSLAVVFTGGNPVTPTLVEAWAKKGVGLRQAYGLTESLSMVTFPTAELAMRKPESVGLGGVLTEVRIVDVDGTPCPPGTPGEIWISGPGVAAGYWRDDALTEAVFGGGRLRTGDIGVRDEDGTLRIVGRTKDLIKSGGMTIYAAEIERAVLELPQVLEAAVIGVADPEFGETPALLLTAKGLTVQDVIEHCKVKLAAYKVPRYVVFREEPLPRTSSMKIDKRPLRAAGADIPERHERIGRTPHPHGQG
ncbi:fatty-acyl-CoA synthase [Actinocorallia herbida]|uniref:Fatty-acyl-CoA synthase n=1 Tax=Actinocorallia herbida TaxID=58109 RepID=A0A3N1CX89_9ACTN|nr:class I adenylate-forming enzyme family protein [Actinocorallia herbida]ROO85891.1 fatty-acyl-CoA synthase [Actinocorallia herbida]